MPLRPLYLPTTLAREVRQFPPSVCFHSSSADLEHLHVIRSCHSSQSIKGQSHTSRWRWSVGPVNAVGPTLIEASCWLSAGQRVKGLNCGRLGRPGIQCIRNIIFVTLFSYVNPLLVCCSPSILITVTVENYEVQIRRCRFHCSVDNGD